MRSPRSVMERRRRVLLAYVGIVAGVIAVDAAVLSYVEIGSSASIWQLLGVLVALVGIGLAVVIRVGTRARRHRRVDTTIGPAQTRGNGTLPPRTKTR